MQHPLRLFLLAICFIAALSPSHRAHSTEYEIQTISGWTVHVNTKLLTQDVTALKTALRLLQGQLDEVVRVVPRPAVIELQKVHLWFSPEYPDRTPRAEYHSAAEWLRNHGRDPSMAKGVEFSNVRIFEAETRRMPNFALHELAHAYHDRVIRLGFANLEIKAAYEMAKASGIYDRVERKDSEGRSRFDRAYAMTNPREYFAETTEAFFSRNDFYPFTREELTQHDPQAVSLLQQLWGTELKP